MSAEIRIYTTNKGPTCGRCVIETKRQDEAEPFPFPKWMGGYCSECCLTMPADFDNGGRTRPTRLTDLMVMESVESIAARVDEMLDHPPKIGSSDALGG